jgi:hypothetical protein
MPFIIQDPESGLYWSKGLFGRVFLSVHADEYDFDGTYIKNYNTRGYLTNRFNVLHEGGGLSEFSFKDDGTILCDGLYVCNGTWVGVSPDVKTQWIKTDVVEDVPVSRSAALIEAALNAKCDCKCEDCDCSDCQCPKDE